MKTTPIYKGEKESFVYDSQLAKMKKLGWSTTKPKPVVEVETPIETGGAATHVKNTGPEKTKAKK